MDETAEMTLTELADHIEATHHAYLRLELPRLGEMAKSVASLHGEADPQVHEVRKTLLALAEELSSHMMKEEQVLFPLVRRLDEAEGAPTFHCGTLANPVRQMELEHDQASSALQRLRSLTDGFAVPEVASSLRRALIEGLAHLERDMIEHIHKENEVLFPQALAMEEDKRRATLA